MSFYWLSRSQRSAWLHLMFSVTWWPTRLSAGHFSRENHTVDSWFQDYALFPQREAFCHSSHIDKQNHHLQSISTERKSSRFQNSLIVDRRFPTNADRNNDITLSESVLVQTVNREINPWTSKNLRRGERLENWKTDARLMARVTNCERYPHLFTEFWISADKQRSKVEKIHNLL